jgi:hypothetical protein
MNSNWTPTQRQHWQQVRTRLATCAFDLSRGYTDTARAWLESFCGTGYHRPEEMDPPHQEGQVALLALRVGDPFPARKFVDRFIAAIDRDLDTKPIDPRAWGLTKKTP